MAKNEPSPPRLGRDSLASPPAARRLLGRRLIGGFLRRHRAAEFKRLVEIIGEARGLVPAVAEIDVTLAAGQALESLRPRARSWAAISSKRDGKVVIKGDLGANSN